MEQAFRKDLSHTSWEDVYARQVSRAGLVPEWMDAIRLGAGHRVLEVGAGPGHVSLLLAERVGPDGVVYAVDRSAEALAHLDRRRKERGLSQIRPMVADVATLAPAAELRADCALVTMVLHHAESPPAILRNVHRLLAPRGRAVVAEFHPEGPCSYGAPRQFRIPPEQVQAWCEDAGFLVLNYRRQNPEHYMTVVQQPASG